MTTRCDRAASKLGEVWPDEALLAEVRAHARTCPDCAEEIRAYERVDQALSAYFASRMTQASHPPTLASRGVLIAATAAAAALVLAFWIGTPIGPDTRSSDTASTVTAQEVVDESLEDPNSLAKPSEEASAADANLAPADTPSSGDAFTVIDAAGYEHTLADFRGSVVVLGVFDATGTGGGAFGEIYESIPAQSDLRFLAVSTERISGAPPDGLEGVTIMANRGSGLLGVTPGEYAVLDRDGGIHSRGRLSATPTGEARAAIQSSLAELGLLSE